jgi:hypothetical protein
MLDQRMTQFATVHSARNGGDIALLHGVGEIEQGKERPCRVCRRKEDDNDGSCG